MINQFTLLGTVINYKFGILYIATKNKIIPIECNSNIINNDLDGDKVIVKGTIDYEDTIILRAERVVIISAHKSKTN